jgi:hypothetical protein
MDSILNGVPAVEPDTSFTPTVEDDAWVAETFAQSERERTLEQLERATAAVRRWTEQPAPIRDAAGLVRSISDHLKSLGLEPRIVGDVVAFMFLGSPCEFEFTNLDVRYGRGPSDDELAAGASGLAVG